MRYVVKGILQAPVSPLPRRLLMVFVAVCFLAAATGAISILHHHDDHSGPADSQCQICYLLTVAAIGQVVTLIILFLLAASSRRLRALPVAIVNSGCRLVTAAPRAPPSH